MHDSFASNASTDRDILSCFTPLDGSVAVAFCDTLEVVGIESFICDGQEQKKKHGIILWQMMLTAGDSKSDRD
jgi:hypothetical protein